MKTNITVGEIKKALEFAEAQELEDNHIVVLEIKDDNGIGSVLLMSNTWEGEQTDITDYENW